MFLKAYILDQNILFNNQSQWASILYVYMKSGLQRDVHWTSKGRLMPIGMTLKTTKLIRKQRKVKKSSLLLQIGE